MGLNDFILNCEKDNKELRKNIEYYKNKNQRLEKENQELKKQLEEANEKLYLCTPEIPQSSHGTFRRYVDLVNEIYELKKKLEVGEEQYNDLFEEKEKLKGQLSSIILELEEYKNQVNKGLYSTCLPYSAGYNNKGETYYDIIKKDILGENANLKQALNEIRDYCNNNIEICKNEQTTDEWECCIEELEGVLKILDKIRSDE